MLVQKYKGVVATIDEEKTYCVYCHTSPSGKKYVGITCQEPERRWKGGSGYWENVHFRNAIKKHGWGNFGHEILEDGLSRKDAINREIYYVALYRSNEYAFGYNATAGGEGCNGSHRSEETKRILSEKCSGFKHTPEAVEKIRATSIANWTRLEYRARMHETHSGVNHFLYGKKMSPETLAKLSKARKGIKHTPEWIAWAKERFKGEGNPNYGRKFDEAFCEKQRELTTARMTNPEARQHLRDCFEHKQIEQYNNLGKLIGIYDGLHEAERQTGVRASNISLCCRGTRNTASGYIWKYAEGGANVHRAHKDI